MRQDLAGKTVVVIGGSAGIGFAVARLCREAGARTVIAGRSPEKLSLACGQVPGLESHPVDARDEAVLAQLFSAIGAFDHLVVTVGPGTPNQRYRGFAEQPTSDAEALFTNKFWAHYKTAKHAVSRLKRDGSITLFAGGSSRRPIANMAVLAAVNAAVEGFARGLALDLAPIRVNVVSPGRIASQSFDALPAAEREAMFEAWAQTLPVKRIGRPEDAAQAALFLMQNGYSTGSVVYVDGGHFLS